MRTYNQMNQNHDSRTPIKFNAAQTLNKFQASLNHSITQYKQNLINKILVWLSKFEPTLPQNRHGTQRIQNHLKNAMRLLCDAAHTYTSKSFFYTFTLHRTHV